MRVAGHDGVRIAVRESEQRFLQRDQRAYLLQQGLPREQPQIERYLVVAAARGVEPRRRLADALLELALDERVDVFPRGVQVYATGRELLGYRSQAGEDLAAVVAGDDPAADQHPAVGGAPGDVVRPEPVVEADGG